MLFLFYGFLVFNKYCIATNPNNNPIIIKKKDKSTIMILFSKAKTPFKIKNILAISSKTVSYTHLTLPTILLV